MGALGVRVLNPVHSADVSGGWARWLVAIVAVLAVQCASTWAVTITPLASYEPSETDLTVAANPDDTGLTVTIVPGGVDGAPPATDGAYVLKVDFVGEDGKVDFVHAWSASNYDLDGQDELLADVYIATASALPSSMGVWSPNWDPPDAWQAATGIPTSVGAWTTISMDVSARTQTGLNYIWSFVFDGLPGADGTAYVDNLRFRAGFAAPGPTGFAAVAYADRIDLVWKPVADAGLQGYNVYRADAETGPFVKLNDELHVEAGYTDVVATGTRRYYYVTSVIDGDESLPSETVSAMYDGMTDDELLDAVQEATLRYFWDYGHPVCGMAREGIGFGHSSDTVTTGGTGMGLITIMVGAQRGFITRAEAASRILQILTFLDDTVTRYHGAWAHHYNGATGATIPFAGYKDNGGDLVETAFLVEGILTVRQYFNDPVDPVETEIRQRATAMWEGVEWDWYRRFAGSDILYWHWSPDYGWDLNLPIIGYNEAMIIYLLAIASPTHAMPTSSYYNGWASSSAYGNSNTFYGYRQWVGPNLGGPLFFTHYSYLGFDPRYKRDSYCNYFNNSRHISLIHQAYSIDNPNGFAGYSALVWGLTASFDPFGYDAHSPTNDNGTITPTAAISAVPYTPAESLATIRHFLDTYGADLWGPYGFYDAFNPTENWFAPGYIAIDEGTIVPMIENYRSGLCWKMFMANPEIKPALHAIGWLFSGDFDDDGDIDLTDYSRFATCVTGPVEISSLPPGCSAADFIEADLDGDNDVDLSDAAIFQELFNAS